MRSPRDRQRECTLADFKRFFPGGAGRGVLFRASRVLVSPGFLAVRLLREQELHVAHGRWLRAHLIRTLCNAVTGADFVPGVSCGPGLVLHHPTGVVFGEGVRLGSDCTVLQNVTLGERWVDDRSDGAYPTLGNGVVLGAGAVVLGPLSIGDGAIVGANAVVLADVAPGDVVVGSPAATVATSRARPLPPADA